MSPVEYYYNSALSAKLVLTNDYSCFQYLGPAKPSDVTYRVINSTTVELQAQPSKEDNIIGHRITIGPLLSIVWPMDGKISVKKIGTYLVLIS